MYFMTGSLLMSSKEERDMKIVINALPYKQNSSGIGVMIRELFGLYSDITKHPCQVILSKDAPEFPANGRTELIHISINHRQGLRRIFFQSFQMGRKYCRDKVLLTTDSKVPFFLPKSCKLVPVVTDLAVFRMPAVYNRSRVLLWRLQYGYVLRRADLFLAISEFTKCEMSEVFGIPPERIRVVPMACSESLQRVEDLNALTKLHKKYGLPERFVLFVGNNNPRKNLERTIRAFDLMKERTDFPHKLVIAGEQGWKFNRENALEGVKHREDVRFIGFVADEDMPALYSAADLFAFPTLYEGFGMPVIEAQKCGTPVVTSNCSSLPEVVETSAELVDPYNEQSICAGLTKILSDIDYAETLTRRGYENAKRFSWKKSAELLDQIIDEEVLHELPRYISALDKGSV